jgi:predicted XRE-type DNA-binding protein
MSDQEFDNVWDAIADTPEEAENMKLRSTLMVAVTQPRVSDLMRGKINLFALDALVNMATAAGLRIEMRVLEMA